MTDTEIYPFRPGFTGTSPREVTDAIRLVLIDWDGVNWNAVRNNIEFYYEERGLNPQKSLDAWTLSDVRQHYSQRNGLIIAVLGTAATHTGTTTPATFTTIRIPVEMTVDVCPVTGKQLASHVGCDDKVIREALLACPKVSEGKGRSPHRWRYCDALPILQAVDSGCLKGIVWPNSASELATKKHSNKIPTRSLTR